MWLFLLTFLLASSACFAILTFLVYGGRNQPEADAAAGPPRPMIFGALTPALAGLLPVRQQTQELCARFLRQAGYYHRQAATEFFALRNVLVVGTLLLTATAVVVMTRPGDPQMFQLSGGGLLAMVLLFGLPRLGLETMAKGRARRIEESLPDAMDMITMCTSAGLPLQQAVARVSGEMQRSHPDLAFELRIVGRQTEAASLNSAIQQFAKRIDIPEIHSIAAMVWQAEQQGASVAGAFHSFADQMRLNRRQKAEEAGNKAAFKMLFPLVFCLAPAVYLVLLGPAVMDLGEFFRREREPGGVLSTAAGDIQSALSEPDLPPGTVPGTP